MGSLLPGWNAAAEAPSPTRRWSDTVRRQDLETLRREERRHREARARLSAAAARADDAVARLRAGAARASSPGPPFAGTPPVGSRRREDEEDEEDEFFDEATEDLLREMRLGAWHRLLSDARRSLEPDPGDGELSVDSAVVSGVAAALNADSASFGDARRKTRALDALALEKSGGRGPFFDGERNRGCFGHAETTTRDDDERKTAFALRTEHVAEGKTPRVRVRLEVVDDDGGGEEEEEEEKKKEPVFSGDADRESFVRVVEEARRRRAAAAAAAAAARPSGWWDRTESAHLNRDVSREG
jgi:hypothetical protein